ncbi:MAG: alpha-ketoacid dehydrogenase subunit beta [Spirochaetia bacterium]|nr:alpha-ketoacid dehydrogenase subunit beta [Spirochaetia bacterium]
MGQCRTYAQAVYEAIYEEMQRDIRVFVMGEDVGAYGGTFGVLEGLVEEFGVERVRDTPISESGFTGAAVGAAMTGTRPVVEIMFSDFLTVAMDQVVNHAAKMRYMFGGAFSVPLVIRMPGGSGTGAGAQHSQSIEAWFTHTPGLKVVVPSNPADAKGLLKASIRDDNPVLFFEQKTLYKTEGIVPDASADYIIPLGKADVKRPGDDITIVTYGRMVPRAMEAAEMLKGKGIESEVVDLRTLVPYDEETVLASVKKTRRVLIVHEAVKTGGFGAEIAARIAEHDVSGKLLAPTARLAGKDIPMPFSKVLEDAAVPTTADIVEKVKAMIM